MERREKDLLIFIIILFVALIGFCTYIYCGGGNGHGCGRGHDGEGVGYGNMGCEFPRKHSSCRQLIMHEKMWALNGQWFYI